MLEKLWATSTGLSRRFPRGNEPFQMVTRLLEECGELAKEVQDVLRRAPQVAQYYGVEQELKASVEQSYQRLKAEGFIE